MRGTQKKLYSTSCLFETLLLSRQGRKGEFEFRSLEVVDVS